MKRIILLLVTMVALNLGNVSGQQVDDYIGSYIEDVIPKLGDLKSYFNIERQRNNVFLYAKFSYWDISLSFLQEDVCSIVTYTMNSEEDYWDMIVYYKDSKDYKEGEERSMILKNFTFISDNGWPIYCYVQKFDGSPYFIQFKLIEDANDTVARRRARAEKRGR
jgi:hypothetical protein